MNTQLKRIRVAGFRSLKDVTLELTPVTVLIGPNGSGKSNLLWAFEMVRFLAFGSLQLFVGERGGSTYLLHYGPKRTPAVDLRLDFEADSGAYTYEARLGYSADESFVFLSERAGTRKNESEPWRWSNNTDVGHRESGLKQAAKQDATVKTVYEMLRQINFYHFHDTSGRSPLRTRDFADTAGNYLRSDGSNLATFLRGLRESDAPENKAAWQRLMFHVQTAAPFIRDILPIEEGKGTALNWQDETGATFGPAHLSDGTLRAIALFAALEQPRQRLPLVSCFDEPELGLHPSAMSVFAGAVRSVAHDRQVLLATQSPALLDQLEPEQVVVAERKEAATALRRLEPADLAQWLEEFRLSDLYESNLLGGRP